jgi:phage shock protein PspC (stress-responsive transcriptional regulator)
MDKTIKINLGGILFQADEEAYTLLRRYLQDIDNRLKNMPGGAETIEDIELRIAEIFQSQGGSAGVINKDNVEAMISILGRPEDFDTNGEPAEERPKYYSSGTRKKMYRNPDDMIIGGVCSGMGIYLNIEPVWIRSLFVIFAFFAGIGFFVYLALWIALPSARTETMKWEMYGDKVHTSGKGQPLGNTLSQYNESAVHAKPSGFGNALNEIFRAIGRVCFIAFRIILIILGLSIVLAGFISLVALVMVFIFKYPGYFSAHAGGVSLSYFPDFLNYVVNPAIAPWIIALTFIIILLPLLAMIYWGVKMIFWFRAKDGIFALAGLVLWVISIAALSMILFNEGISFSETAKTGSEEILNKSPDDLYIYAGNKVADLHHNKEVCFTEDGYNIYFTDDNKGLFISPGLKINNSNDDYIKINIRKRATGRSRMEATDKAEGIKYGYRVTGDTLYLDEYFAVPSERKWSFDNVTVNLYIPEGTTIHFDRNTEKLFHPENHDNDDWDLDSDDDSDYRKPDAGDLIWIMTEDGAREKSDFSVTGK